VHFHNAEIKACGEAVQEVDCQAALPSIDSWHW